MKKVLKVFIILLQCLMLQSFGCDPGEFVIDSIVENKLNQTITLEITGYYNQFTNVTSDTSFTIPSSQNRLIRPDAAAGIGDANDIYPIEFFYYESITITKEDGTVSNKDFANRQEWDFFVESDEYCYYELIIDESDF